MNKVNVFVKIQLAKVYISHKKQQLLGLFEEHNLRFVYQSQLWCTYTVKFLDLVYHEF